MDKVEMNQNDITMLLDWRDAHKDLVRSLPAPLKAVEIVMTHNAYRIKGIRKDNSLTLYLRDGSQSLGHIELRIGPNNILRPVKGKLLCNRDGFDSVLTVYCSLMALMVYGGADQTPPAEPTEVRHTAAHKPRKGPCKGKPHQVTYILRRANGILVAAPKGSHASPRGEFTVRGHYRHYASGKVVWIAEYRKGTGKKKSKTYKMGGNTK